MDHTPNNGRRVDADYNVFGYDPNGLLAHLASHFFGPEWVPPMNNGPSPHGVLNNPQAPRYGPPAPHQVPYLPANFRSQRPPEYYGPSHPPYITAPPDFHPSDFAALAQCKRVVLLCADLTNEKRNKRTRDDSEAVDTDVDDETESMIVNVPSSANRTSPTSHNSLNQTLPDSVKPERPTKKLRAKRKLGFMNPLDPGLSSVAPDIETYPFEYPSADYLISILDASDPTGKFLEVGDHQVLRLAGIENVDDFTWISQQDLHSTTEILPTKIVVLYEKAQQMILSVHMKKQKEIDEIKEMREMRRRCDKRQRTCSNLDAQSRVVHWSEGVSRLDF